MKRLFTILFALFVSFYCSAQCTDPSASNYNLNGWYDVLTYPNNEGEIIWGPCCYETSMIISPPQGAIVTINNETYSAYENTYCLVDGLYTVEVSFFDFGDSQVTIQLSDGQSFSLDSSLGSPYIFQLSVGDYVYGCTDPNACDFNPAANTPLVICDYSCLGCMDSDAINYDANAQMDDGSCVYNNYTVVSSGPFSWSYTFYDGNQINGQGELLSGSASFIATVPGSTACHCIQFEPLIQDADYQVSIYNQFMELVNSIELTEYVVGPLCYNEVGVIPGCPDPDACNYDPNANCGGWFECIYDCYGCTNPLAENYDPSATIDDASCCVGEIFTFDYGTSSETDFISIWSGNGDWMNYYYEEQFCFRGGCLYVEGYSLSTPTVVTAYRSDGSIAFQCSSFQDYYGSEVVSYVYCQDDVWGCQDEFACNFNPSANVDIGCDYSCHGCTDPSAPNYNPQATIENNTCCYDSWFTLEFSEPCFWYLYNPLAGFYISGNYPEDSGYCSDQFIIPSTWDMPVVDDDHAQISGSRFIADCYILEAISVSGNPVDFTITDGNGIVIASSTGNTNPILNADVSENTDEEPGCTDPIACNYNINASCNNGSCIYDCGGCTDMNALNFNSVAAWEDGSCQYTIQAPVVTYTTSPATLPDHFMIEFNVQELGNSLEYILSSDYNTAQRMVNEYATYEMGPYPCDVAIDFKMRSLDFNLVEAWSIEDIQILCSSLSVDETRTESSFGFYPNPANDRIMLTGLAVEQYTLQIIDIAGRVAFSQTIIGNAAGVEVDLNNLQSGAYIVRVFNDAGSQSARLILEGN